MRPADGENSEKRGGGRRRGTQKEGTPNNRGVEARAGRRRRWGWRERRKTKGGGGPRGADTARGPDEPRREGAKAAERTEKRNEEKPRPGSHAGGKREQEKGGRQQRRGERSQRRETAQGRRRGRRQRAGG